MQVHFVWRRNSSLATGQVVQAPISFFRLPFIGSASAATAGGHLQTALPDARGTPPPRSLLSENAHPVKL